MKAIPDPNFEEFVKRVRDQSPVDVLGHSIPNTIWWGSNRPPDIYQFDAARASKDGVDALVNEALALIRLSREP
jgi:hypothetical protein